MAESPRNSSNTIGMRRAPDESALQTSSWKGCKECERHNCAMLKEASGDGGSMDHVANMHYRASVRSDGCDS